MKTLEGAEEKVSLKTGVCCVQGPPSCWRLNRLKWASGHVDLPSVCVQQCQWEPGAADVSFSASVSHPCSERRGRRVGGVRKRQKSAAQPQTVKEQWLLLWGLRAIHSERSLHHYLCLCLKLASTHTPLKHTEETRNPVGTERMEPSASDNLCLVCTLSAAFF